MPTIITQSDEHADPAELKNDLQNAVDADLSFEEATRHDDWETGEPCPECGHTQMSVVVPVEDIFESEHGNFEYRGNGDFTGAMVSVLCMDCGETLLDKPYEFL